MKARCCYRDEAERCGKPGTKRVNSGSASRAVRLILPPAFEYSAVLSHLIKLSAVPVPATGEFEHYQANEVSRAQ